MRLLLATQALSPTRCVELKPGNILLIGHRQVMVSSVQRVGSTVFTQMGTGDELELRYNGMVGVVTANAVELDVSGEILEFVTVIHEGSSQREFRTRVMDGVIEYNDSVTDSWIHSQRASENLLESALEMAVAHKWK